MDTKPAPLNSILWSSLIETDKGYRTAYYSLFDTQEITYSKEFGDHSIKELEAVRGQYVFELPDPDKPVPSAETMQRAKELSKESAAGKVQVKSVEKLTAFDLHKKGIG